MSHHRPCFLSPHANRLPRQPIVSIICHGQRLDITRTVLLLVRAHEEHRGHRRRHLRPGRCLSPEPATPGAALRKGGASGRSHQYGPASPRPHGSVAARYRLPGAQRPHLSEPGAAVRGARRGHPRLGHVVCRVVPADRPRVQQPRRQRVLRAAAEPGQARRTSPCSGRSCASIGKRRRCSMRRKRSARRWETFSSRAVSASAFTHRYLLPMASAIWSASLDAIRSFPALTLIRFFDNHGLLSLHEQPTWKVVAGGSHTYIPKLTAPLSGGVHERRGDSGCAAKRARRHDRLPRSPADGVRRGGVRVPRRSGAAAARRPERSASVRSCRTSPPRPMRRGCTPTRRCCRCSRGRARRGITCSPQTPRRRRW